ncbi:hypothetical protein Q8A73_006113 [Channa argus]|nr:hypothetical protein Q8A73_006113 [Channa argus]
MSRCAKNFTPEKRHGAAVEASGDAGIYAALPSSCTVRPVTRGATGAGLWCGLCDETSLQLNHRDSVRPTVSEFSQGLGAVADWGKHHFQLPQVESINSAYRYPFYAVQWHPEKSAYKWIDKPDMVHSAAADANNAGDYCPIWGSNQGFQQLPYLTANKDLLTFTNTTSMALPLTLTPGIVALYIVFVFLSFMKSHHHCPSPEEEQNALMYNFAPVFKDTKAIFMQNYYFD